MYSTLSEIPDKDESLYVEPSGGKHSLIIEE